MLWPDAIAGPNLVYHSRSQPVFMERVRLCFEQGAQRMLSIGLPKTPRAAQEYLLRDDPYFGDRNASWFGKGAEALGISGQVEDRAFMNLLDGMSPEGTLLVRAGGPGHRRIAGFDLTFSAPKSCTLVGLADCRIVETHSGAVKKALTFAEARYAQARIISGAKQVEVPTGNLVAALFVHMTSRALDPQLHTHAFVLNITRRLEDGQWRALHRGKQITTRRARAAVVSNPFYTHHLLLGQIYRNEIAAELAGRGYTVRITDPENGFWELAGVPEDLIKAFSKRRDEIEREAAHYLKSRPRALSDEQEVYARATVHTRLWKRHAVDREQLLDMWKATARHLGTPLETLRDRAMLPERPFTEPTVPGPRECTPEELLAKALALCAETQDQIRTPEHELLAALKLGIGSLRIDSLGGAAQKISFKGERKPEAVATKDSLCRHKTIAERELAL
ncbi:MAG: MobF family relaxase [bacterium]